MTLYLAGLALTAGITILALTGRAWPAPTGRHRRTTTSGPGPAVHTAFRYCPTEQRTRGVILHADGTAQCDCGTTIPTTQDHQ